MESYWNSHSAFETHGLEIKPKRKSQPALQLTADDFARTKKLAKAESLDVSSDDHLFRGLVYSVLARATSYGGQTTILTRLEENGLVSPSDFTGRNLSHIVTGILYHNQLAANLLGVANDWWPEHSSAFVENLRRDRSNGSNHAVDLRKQLAATCPGMGLKCSSLFLRMCGYSDIVPLDRWAIRFTRDVIGVPISQVYDKKKVKHGDDKYTRSPTVAQYLGYEKKFSAFARGLQLEPAALQLLLYVHRTQWDSEPHPYLVKQN